MRSCSCHTGVKATVTLLTREESPAQSDLSSSHKRDTCTEPGLPRVGIWSPDPSLARDMPGGTDIPPPRSLSSGTSDATDTNQDLLLLKITSPDRSQATDTSSLGVRWRLFSQILTRRKVSSDLPRDMSAVSDLLNRPTWRRRKKYSGCYDL